MNEEAVCGRLPLRRSEREYNLIGITATGFTESVATWCFLIGGYAAYYVGAVKGIVALLAGCVIGVALSAIASALACNRYGLEQIDYTKSCFGQRGAQAITVFYVINQVGWTGIILVMFANAARKIGIALGWDGGPILVSILALLGMMAAYTIAVRGIQMLNLFNKVVTPGLILICVILFYVIFRHYGWDALLAATPLTPTSDPLFNYILAFEFGLGAGFSWWPGIGFLARNTDTQRNSFYPQVLTMGLGMGVVCLTGLFSALLFKTYDPTEWMMKVGGPWLGMAALLLVAVANVSASSAMMYVAGLALRHVPAFRALPWKHLLALAFVPALAFVVWPQALYEKGSTFLAYNATMFAPISGILLVDYFFLRRQRLNLSQIFENHPKGHYWFYGGFNPYALGCMILGQLLYLFLLDPVKAVGHELFRWLTASGPAMVLPMLLYLFLARLFLVPQHKGGYRAPTDPLPLRSPNI